ncbi:mechanosensitive ion channel [Mucilaginibacter sp. BJC16-A38]|uniref:mechanosensitive ion channel family protein n=1 Tax=Mucilaginibacter phenanthrenivorans TaxID=1234842 RepID=UPI00215852B5|nr:mechanosensitive ion channel domain-containing protein [Mucilaginibacter phenanthrenivorans]MCR8560571.1 mechanosensitive ion channel [Mucilaginibacter phenanthrenivorans]
MRKIIKLTPLIILLLTVFSSLNALAQDKKKKPEVAKRESVRHKMHSRDSLLRLLNKSDTSISSLLQRIAQYTTTFNQINNNLAEGVDTAEISQGFPPVLRRINKIDSLINTHKSSTLRYLFVLRDNLDHLQDDMEGWQSDLEDASTKLIQNQKELIKFAKDTSLKIIPADSLIRETFFAHRKVVRQLFQKTDSVNRASLLKVNLLQDKIAVAYTKVLDETDQIDSKIKKFAIRAINGESDFIWNTGLQNDDFKPALNSTIRLNKILFNYFIKSETYTHYISIVFLILVFVWIIYVRRKTRRHHENAETVLDEANYINKHFITGSLLVAVAIIPYFYGHPPVIFLETLFLLSIVLTLFLVKKNYERCCFTFLHRLFWITIIYGMSNLFIQISNVDRYVVLLLSIASLITAYSFYKEIKKSPDDHIPNAKLGVKIFIALQFLSLLLNITGRFSLSKIIGVTAAFNLWFLVILFFVVQIISQGLFLQFQGKKEGNSILNYIDYTIVQKKLRQVLIVMASLLWLFFLLQNLNIDDWAADNIGDLLSQSQSIGGASFTFGGFIIFIFVIWLSSIVSKVISYFYDVSALRVNDLSVAKKKNRTSTLLIRMAVFSLGFLLAVAASGFPLEKLTIIISAFGVGIGFGLQNIVNNLVSGLILAFEKPIQIGDVIEVDGVSGTMKEIGIRSSKVATGDGAEVIIPNGDLISHHVINWTLSNSNRQVGLVVNTAYGVDINKVKTLLKDLLVKRDDIMTTPGPSVFLNNVSESAVEFKLFFWAADISTVSELRSRVWADIFDAFRNQDIAIPSSKKDLYLHFPDGAPAAILDAKTDQEKNKLDKKEETNKSDQDQDQ